MATKRPLPSFLIFKDPKGHWRWNFASGNGKVVAASSVAYLRRQGALRAVQALKKSSDIPVVGRPADLKSEQPEAAVAAAAGKPEKAEKKS